MQGKQIAIVFQQYNLISKYECFKKCLYSTIQKFRKEIKGTS